MNVILTSERPDRCGRLGDGSAQICLPFPQMTEDSLSLYVSRTKHEHSHGYSRDACPEIQGRAEYYHYLNHTVLEIIIFWKSNLLKIIFTPLMLMVDDYPMMSSLSYDSGYVNIQWRKIWPTWTSCFFRIALLNLGGNISAFLIRKFTEVLTLWIVDYFLRCHLIWFKAL